MPKKTPHEIMEALMRKLKMFRGQPNTPENRAEMLRLIQGRLFDMALDLFWDDLQEGLQELHEDDQEARAEAKGNDQGDTPLEASGPEGGEPGPGDEPNAGEPPPAGTGG